MPLRRFDCHDNICTRVCVSGVVTITSDRTVYLCQYLRASWQHIVLICCAFQNERWALHYIDDMIIVDESIDSTIEVFRGVDYLLDGSERDTRSCLLKLMDDSSLLICKLLMSSFVFNFLILLTRFSRHDVSPGSHAIVADDWTGVRHWVAEVSY